MIHQENLNCCREQEKTGFIDLRSDVVSRAPAQMLEVMSKAQTGDDVFDDDPTANQFQRKIAQKFGKQASIFMPSTSMGNLTAILHWTKPGDQIIVWAHSHLVNRQASSYAAIGGVQTRQIFNQTGIFELQQIQKKARSSYSHITFPSTTLIFVQNPTFEGRVWPLQKLKSIYEYAKQKGIKVHIDGSRIFNAFEFYKSQDPSFQASDMTKYCDSLSMCLSKSLCVPVGSMLVADSSAINKFRWIRKSLGGGLRQIGILAAGGIWALQNIVPGIKQDHQVACLLANKLNQFPQIEKIDLKQVQTNMVLFKFKENIRIKKQKEQNQKDFDQWFKQYLKINGKIKIKGFNEDSKRYRFVTYRQIRQKQIQMVIQTIKNFLHQECQEI